MNKQLRNALIKERANLIIKLEAIEKLLHFDSHPYSGFTVRKPGKSNKYHFKVMEKGYSYIISDHYSREEMTKVSNAARSWSNKGGYGYMFQFKKTPDNKIEIRRIK